MYPLGVISDVVLGLIGFDRFVAYAAVRMFWGVMCRTDSVPSDGACRRTATPAEVDLSPTLDGTDGAHSSQ